MSALVKLYRCWFVWLAVLSRHLVVLSFPFMIETCTVYIIYILCMYCSCICHLIGNKILVLVLVIRRQFMITDAVAQNHTQWYMLKKKKKNMAIILAKEFCKCTLSCLPQMSANFWQFLKMGWNMYSSYKFKWPMLMSWRSGAPQCIAVWN